MSYQYDDTILVELAFIEKRVRGSNKFECFLEVEVSPEASTPCQIVYPLGKSWKDVKKSYPTFIDIMESIARLHEISRELDEIQIISLKGDEGLYDQNIDEWNSNLRDAE